MNGPAATEASAAWGACGVARALRGSLRLALVFFLAWAAVFGYLAYTADSTPCLLLALGALLGVGCLAPAVLRLAAERTDGAGLWLLAALAVFLTSATLALDDAVSFLAAGGVGCVVVGGGLFFPRRWRWWLCLALALGAWIYAVDALAPPGRLAVSESPAAQAFLCAAGGLMTLWVVWASVGAFLASGTIRSRLLIAFVLTVTVPFLAGAGSQLYVALGTGTREAVSRLKTVAGLKEAAARAWLLAVKTDVSMALFDYGPRRLALELLASGGVAPAEVVRALRANLRHFASRSDDLRELLLIDREGVVVLSTSPAHEGEYRGLHGYFQKGMQREAIEVEPGHAARTAGGSLYMATPLTRADGGTAGVLVGVASLAGLGEDMARRPGFSKTTECYLVGMDGRLLSPVLARGLTPGSARVVAEGAACAAVKKTLCSGIFRGYRGTPVVGVYVWLEGLGAVLAVEQDRAEAFALTYDSLRMHSLIGLAALLAAVLAALLLARSMARPLDVLACAAERIQGGELNVTAPEGPGEMGVLARAFNAMTARLRRLIADLEEEVGRKCEAEERLKQHAEALENEIAEKALVEQRLQHQAFHDPLTNLANRSLFVDRVRRALERGQRRENYHCGVLFLDMDRFKVINDSLGHVVGDRLLVETAQRVIENTRSLDTVARLGGDEFVVLLEELNSQREAVVIAKRIRDALALPFFLDGHEVHSSASIGVLLDIAGYGSADNILRDSNIAMHHAKDGGRNRIKVFRTSMHEEAMELLVMESDLRRALVGEEFFVQYQPLYTGAERLCGFEALLRWRHPARGTVPPGDFISVAEDSGLIVPMGEWVLRQACMRLAEWRRDHPGLEDVHMAVNLSAKQFTQENLIDVVAGALRDTGLPPRLLTLEITESVVMDNASRTVRILRRLKEMGVSLSVDDFGTGYSSLSYLQRFPLDVLKIDRSFVMGLGVDEENTEIVRAVLSLAQALGLEVVAEGVTRPEHVAILRELGCQYLQGFLFSRPLDESMAGRLYGDSVPGGAAA
jgi:diguanylate cyclase (GGDEF)-like protein